MKLANICFWIINLALTAANEPDTQWASRSESVEWPKIGCVDNAGAADAAAADDRSGPAHNRLGSSSHMVQWLSHFREPVL